MVKNLLFKANSGEYGSIGHAAISLDKSSAQLFINLINKTKELVAWEDGFYAIEVWWAGVDWLMNIPSPEWDEDFELNEQLTSLAEEGGFVEADVRSATWWNEVAMMGRCDVCLVVACTDYVYFVGNEKYTGIRVETDSLDLDSLLEYMREFDAS